ncbi:hypothetical protein CHS0354_040403 [Potamilus streckersoni]|uniref:Secreted protein n=1 Tax=Potamilus streckersoni TaxID=2493646 RepID=A0AAE0SZU5_9BIVA|nr:hypothetical protein CHS0354_040403 [Potamilus streckersoni]
MLRDTVCMILVVILIGTNSVSNGVNAFDGAKSESEEAIEARERVPSDIAYGDVLKIVRSALEAKFDREGSGALFEDDAIAVREFSEESPEVERQAESVEVTKPMPPNGGESTEIERKEAPRNGKKSPELAMQAIHQNGVDQSEEVEHALLQLEDDIVEVTV